MQNFKFSEKTIEMVKELFERVHNNKKLSDVEEKFLYGKGLKITNTGSDVILHTVWSQCYDDDGHLASVPYFTVWTPSRNDWSKFDNDLKQLTRKSLSNETKLKTSLSL